MKLYRIGSVAFIILGALHITAHVIGNLNQDERTLSLFGQMEAYEIQLFGNHNLLKFHNGFSLMMGFLISVFGIQNSIVSKRPTKNYMISSIIISLIMLGLSVWYFHLLATTFILVSLLCYLIAYKNRICIRGYSPLHKS